MSAELTIPGAIHLAAIVPAVVIGVAQLASKKGTPGRFLAQLLS